MGRWTAMSDYDYYEERNPAESMVERSCVICGEFFLMPRDREYVAHVTCDRCLRTDQRRPADLKRAG